MFFKMQMFVNDQSSHLMSNIIVQLLLFNCIVKIVKTILLSVILIGRTLFTHLTDYDINDSFNRSSKPVPRALNSHLTTSPWSHQHMQKLTNLWKFGLDWSSKLQESIQGKTHLVRTFVCFQMSKKKWLRAIQNTLNIWLRNELFRNTLLQKEPLLTILCILSTVCHCLLPRKLLCLSSFWVIINSGFVKFLWKPTSSAHQERVDIQTVVQHGEQQKHALILRTNSVG